MHPTSFKQICPSRSLCESAVLPEHAIQTATVFFRRRLASRPQGGARCLEHEGPRNAGIHARHRQRDEACGRPQGGARCLEHEGSRNAGIHARHRQRDEACGRLLIHSKPPGELSVSYEQATRRGLLTGARKGSHVCGEARDRSVSGKILWQNPSESVSPLDACPAYHAYTHTY